MKVLVVYWHPPGASMRAAVQSHLHTLDRVLPGDVVYHNGHDPFPIRARRARYRAVVLHNTYLCMRWSDTFANYLARIAWIADLRCPKLAIPQDEYDHSEILDEWLASLGVTHIFSNFGEDERELLYPLMSRRAAFEQVLTGYIDDGLPAAVAAIGRTSDRPLDVVYRSSSLPYWFGRQGQLKVEVGGRVAERARSAGLSTDVSSCNADTLYGDAWTALLLAGKTIVGCETGSGVLDRRGEIQARIRILLDREPDLSFDEVDRQMPSGWDSHRFFAIGPRHLEAVALKTCQLLVEGDYSGLLEPNEHYIPIKRDFSNLDEVIDRIRDHALLTRLAEQAYRDIYVSRRYHAAAFAAIVARAIGGREALRRARPLVAAA